MSDWSELGYQIFIGMSPVLIAILTWASHAVASLIRSKTKNQTLANILVRLDDSVFTAVKAVEQSYVKALKKAAEDGKITKQEKEEARQTAVELAKSYLGPKGIKELLKVLGMHENLLDSFIGDRVEAAVHTVQEEKSSVNPS